jgi:hypothetical protein
MAARGHDELLGGQHQAEAAEASGDQQAQAEFRRLKIDELPVSLGPPARGEVIMHALHCPLTGPAVSLGITRGSLPRMPIWRPTRMQSLASLASSAGMTTSTR